MRYQRRSQSTPKPKRKPGPDAARILNFRVPPSTHARLQRIVRMMSPRILAITGRKASTSDVVRAVLLRGIEFTEREFGLEENTSFVLIDEEEDR